MANTTFTYFNPNPDRKMDKKTGKPKTWRKGDCVVRAFCGVLEKPWSTVFKELCEVGAKEFDMPNSNKVIDVYAKNNGMTKVSLPDYMTVSKFAQTHPGKYLVHIRGHVACVKDNKINDCWNCGGYKMKTYYAVAE